MAGRIPVDVVSRTRSRDGVVVVVEVSSPVSERVNRAVRLRARREITHAQSRSARIVDVSPAPVNGRVRVTVAVSRIES